MKHTKHNLSHHQSFQQQQSCNSSLSFQQSAKKSAHNSKRQPISRISLNKMKRQPLPLHSPLPSSFGCRASSPLPTLPPRIYALLLLLLLLRGIFVPPTAISPTRSMMPIHASSMDGMPLMENTLNLSVGEAVVDPSFHQSGYSLQDTVEDSLQESVRIGAYTQNGNDGTSREASFHERFIHSIKT